MILERFRRDIDKESFGPPVERDLASLMISHYQKIEDVLLEKDNASSRVEWVLDHIEVESGGERCLVVAGLFPALDESGKEIPGVRATPSVICIPKGLMKEDEWDTFSKEGGGVGGADKKESVVRDIVRNPALLKLYNAHGWGGNPYVMGRPMIDMAVEYGAVSVLMGVMGSMKTSRVDMSSREYRDSGMYGWHEIKKQVMGMMYQVEGKDQFVQTEDNKLIRRVLLGHSMQGRTTLRLLVEELSKLPNTYFVPITPVMRGAKKGKERHVILGHDNHGRLMKAEMEITSRLMKEETREKILSWALPVIKGVIKHYLHDGLPYAENLLMLSHLLEYINNPWAVMNATKLLDNADESIGKNTRHMLVNHLDLFMLICAVEDKVLSPEQLKEMIVDLATPMRLEKGELIVEKGNEYELVRACFFPANHYLAVGNWNMLRCTELAFDLKKKSINFRSKNQV